MPNNSEWKPIDSAPRDGSRIDVFVQAEGRITDVFWGTEDSRGHEYPPPRTGWVYLESGVEGPYLRYIDNAPTHWMPIPDPPLKDIYATVLVTGW